MALILATWAHGNAVVAQHPAGGALQDVDGKNFTSVVGYREGSMAVYEGTGSWADQDSDTWFHIPVPTVSWLPTTAGGGPSGRAFLDNFGVLFRAENCSVSSIEAWDGGSRFFAPGVPNMGGEAQMSGDWTEFGKVVSGFQGNTRITLSNVFTPRDTDSSRRSVRHAMLFGLGISVKVNFTNSPRPKRICFLGAGANWHDVGVG
ncbi:MAG: hypothetical protein WAQ99_22240 [Pyrinomonadaceae bacterium]